MSLNHYKCYEFHLMNDRPVSLVNLLTCSDTERSLLEYIADNAFV